jgi:hypothetical protein
VNAVPDLPRSPDLSHFRRAVQLRDRCREAAVANGERLGIPLSGVQANVAYDAMAHLIRAAAAEQADDRA